jgi:hypothetical protein
VKRELLTKAVCFFLLGMLLAGFLGSFVIADQAGEDMQSRLLYPRPTHDFDFDVRADRAD